MFNQLKSYIRELGEMPLRELVALAKTLYIILSRRSENIEEIFKLCKLDFFNPTTLNTVW